MVDMGRSAVFNMGRSAVFGMRRSAVFDMGRSAVFDMGCLPVFLSRIDMDTHVVTPMQTGSRLCKIWYANHGCQDPAQVCLWYTSAILGICMCQPCVVFVRVNHALCLRARNHTLYLYASITLCVCTLKPCFVFVRVNLALYSQVSTMPRIRTHHSHDWCFHTYYNLAVFWCRHFSHA